MAIFSPTIAILDLASAAQTGGFSVAEGASV
jgi:hypothetical protein